MTSEVEVIEFIKPHESPKNVYVTRLPSGMPEDELQEIFYTKFSKFGLIYDIKLYTGSDNFAANLSSVSCTDGPKGEKSENDQASYGFVTFYSEFAAQAAIHNLTGQFFLKGSLIKVQLAKKRPPPPPQALFITKCYELASYYLGFNGWTVSIDKVLEAPQEEQEPGTLRFVTQVTLTLVKHNLYTEGLGEAIEKFNMNDPKERLVAFCKAKKLSYSAAAVDAFQRVVLVVTQNGKLHVEINTTVEDLLSREMNLDPQIKINELEESPGEESDEEDPNINFQDTLDAINVDILAQLES